MSAAIEPGAQLARNLERVRARIAAAAQRAGRAAGEVRLVAVTKSVDAVMLPLFCAAGLQDLGENRVQQLVARAAALPPGLAPRWHMIGHLQRNKVRALLPHCQYVHSVDSLRLAEELSSAAGRLGLRVEALLEVNVSGEQAKYGAAPEEAPRLLAAAAALPQVTWRGLMTMAPYTDDPQAARPHFARLRALRDELIRAGAAPPECRELSMGMSGDFEVAIEEGATIVRIGSDLCAGLAPSRS